MEEIRIIVKMIPRQGTFLKDQGFRKISIPVNVRTSEDDDLIKYTKRFECNSYNAREVASREFSKAVEIIDESGPYEVSTYDQFGKQLVGYIEVDQFELYRKIWK